MERVQFQQEQMLHELKDLVEKSLFTEVRIVKLKGGRVFLKNWYRRKSKKS
jgi:U3 small nucleolar RNA-associated protein 6